MFTGIVEEMGKLTAIQKGTHSARLTIAADRVMEGLRVGDSVCTNGVCLTATEVQGGTFSCDVMHETLNRSGLGDLRIGQYVNLERAMPATGRFDGHIVSGHIDGQGKVLKTWQDDVAIWFQIQPPRPLLRWIVEKGSIAIDGISLTVAGVTEDSFTVSIIPITQKHTVLQFKRPGDRVNLECDIVGKYVEKLLTSPPPPAETPGNSANQGGHGKGLTKAMLLENGFYD